jgi:hypothetical protein
MGVREQRARDIEAVVTARATIAVAVVAVRVALEATRRARILAAWAAVA